MCHREAVEVIFTLPLPTRDIGEQGSMQPYFARARIFGACNIPLARETTMNVV